MAVSSVQPGYQIIDMSSKMAEEAALEINTNTLPGIEKDKSFEFNKVEFKSPDFSVIEPLSQLSQAERYAKVGTNMIQRDQEMIGSLLDIHV